MHETGIVRDMVRRLEAMATEAGATRIASVDVRLGALSAFPPAHFREHFDEEALGTRAEGATLNVRVLEDATDPHAQDVMIESVMFEVPDAGGG
jgi:hydrogenase nickel incorporation protein HypA/HybF